MVMTLLGSSISDLWWEATRGRRGLDTATCIALAVNMLQLLEQLHGKGFIHRDIKPANFVMSGGDGGGGDGHLCLIDFGLAVPFEEEKLKKIQDSQIVSSTWGKQFFGTVLYGSITAHNGGAQSYRDDLEALVYVFAFLTNGGLPWSGARDPDKVAAMKVSALESILSGKCEECSAEFGRSQCDLVNACDRASARVIREMLAHCRTLEFDERPDYALCRGVLERAYFAATGKAQVSEEYEWRQASYQAPLPTNFYDLMM